VLVLVEKTENLVSTNTTGLTISIMSASTIVSMAKVVYCYFHHHGMNQISKY